ncbi:MAG: M48 family metalloprotease [Nitrospirota bacterium]
MMYNGLEPKKLLSGTGRPLLLLILHIACYFLLFACAVDPITGHRQFMLVSEGQEVAMGKDLYPNALWSAEGGGGEYRDEKLKNYLKDIILRVHGVSHRPHLPVEFAIQNSSAPNAWAIPGYVVITRGLLAGLDSEAEFAFVMGHEMGHVSARHSAEQMTSSLLMQLGLAGIGIGLSGTGYTDIATGLGSVGGSLVLLKYSRNHELEADRLGVLYMTMIGYDPRGAISAHRNLERVSREYLRALGEEPQERGFFEELLSTHPRSAVRIDEIETIITTTPRTPLLGDGKFGGRFQEMTADVRTVNKLYLDYYDKAARAFQKNDLEEADWLVTKALGANQRQPAFYALKGFIKFKKKDYAEAEENFNAVLDLDKTYAPAYRGLGAVRYAKGDYAESIRFLKQGLELFPQDLVAQYYAGMSHFKMRSYRQAIRHLQPFAGAQPKHPEVHGVLGISFEHLNDIKAAYNEYVKQLKVAPDNEMGRYAASRLPILRALIEGRRMR